MVYKNGRNIEVSLSMKKCFKELCIHGTCNNPLKIRENKNHSTKRGVTIVQWVKNRKGRAIQIV
jgi:hypothetical protein